MNEIQEKQMFSENTKMNTDSLQSQLKETEKAKQLVNMYTLKLYCYPSIRLYLISC